jgi:hypothetical protein
MALPWRYVSHNQRVDFYGEIPMGNPPRPRRLLCLGLSLVIDLSKKSGILTMKKLGFHQKMGDLLGFDHEQLWISWDFMGFSWLSW